jgi:hypothetical protein
MSVKIEGNHLTGGGADVDAEETHALLQPLRDTAVTPLPK